MNSTDAINPVTRAVRATEGALAHKGSAHRSHPGRSRSFDSGDTSAVPKPAVETVLTTVGLATSTTLITGVPERSSPVTTTESDSLFGYGYLIADQEKWSDSDLPRFRTVSHQDKGDR